MWLDLQNLRKHGVSTISAALSQVRDEEQWTFGQVLAVLLLALPLLNLVETLALEVGGRRNPSVATSRGSAEDTMLQRQCGGLFPARLDRSCYTAVVGLGPCIVGVAGSALALTVHFGASVSNYTSPIARDSRESVFDFLVSRRGIAALVIMAFPLSCFSVFVAGLLFEPWLQRPPCVRGKYLLVYFLSLIIFFYFFFLGLLVDLPGYRTDFTGPDFPDGFYRVAISNLCLGTILLGAYMILCVGKVLIKRGYKC